MSKESSIKNVLGVLTMDCESAILNLLKKYYPLYLTTMEIIQQIPYSETYVVTTLTRMSKKKSIIWETDQSSKQNHICKKYSLPSDLTILR